MKKLFTFIIIISPLLAVYVSPFLTFTLADMALFLITPLIIVDTIHKKKLSFINQFLIIVLYMVLQLLFLGLIETDLFSKVLMPTARLIFYYTIIAIFLKNYFDTEYGFKIYKKIAVFASLFLILQFVVLHLTGKYIPGYLPFLNVPDIIRNHAATITTAGRVRSLFREPSHYAIYCALYLAIDLISINKKINISIIIVTMAMLLSASSTAIFMVAIIYAMFIYHNYKAFLSKYFFHIIAISIIIVPIIYIYTHSVSFEIFVNRTFETDQAAGRFSNYDLIFKDETKTLPQKIFGESILKIEDYIPSIPRIYLYFGIIGILYFIVITFKNLFKTQGVNKLATIITIILMFPTEFTFGINMLLYAPFIYLDFKK